MLTEAQILEKYKNGDRLVVACVGDSLTYGVYSNVGTNLHTNGYPYLFNNQGVLTPNADPSSPYYLDHVGYLSQSQQNDVTMPTWPRLLWNDLLTKNPTSVVYNLGVSGATAATHLAPIPGEVGNTPQNINALPVTPDLAIIMLGPNSAKSKQSQEVDLDQLVQDINDLDIFVVLCHPTNIGIEPTTESPVGPNFGTSLPETWVPLRSFKNTNDDIDRVFKRRKTGFFTCGTFSLTLDITKMYDPFHPNPAGFELIRDRAVQWFNEGTHFDDGTPIRTIEGYRYFQPTNGNQAFRSRLSTGQLVSIPLKSELTKVRIDSGSELSSFKK